MAIVNRLRSIAAAALLCACAAAGGAPRNLVGTEWMRVDDENAAPHFATLGFTQDGASGYFPGCGPWSARVSASGTSLSFHDIAPAEPECGAESSAAAAQSMLHALDATRSALVEGEELSLRDARGMEVARFSVN